MAKKEPAGAARGPNRYSAIVGTIFRKYYTRGTTEFEFSRDEFVGIAQSLNIAVPKNLGDTIYSFRFRTALPPEILATAPEGMEWEIELAGKGRYRFKLGKFVRMRHPRLFPHMRSRTSSRSLRRCATTGSSTFSSE